MEEIDQEEHEWRLFWNDMDFHDLTADIVYDDVNWGNMIHVAYASLG